MANKTIKSRIQVKTDTAENWSYATSFIPLSGEIIIYSDGSGGETAPQIKVGDGTHTVGSLPFTTKNFLSSYGGIITGDLEVTGQLKAAGFKITSLPTRSTTVTNVLTQNDNDSIIQKRSADNLLQDIGGISYSVNDTSGVLAFKYGKQ